MAATSLHGPRGREVREEVGMEKRREKGKGRKESSRFSEIGLLPVTICVTGVLMRQRPKAFNRSLYEKSDIIRR